MSLPCLRQTDAGVELFLFVQPRASRNKIAGLQGDEIKLALTAPPVDGAANKACCLFVAKLFRLPKKNVRVVSGETSRHKRVLLEGIKLSQVSEQVTNLLGA